jgi:Rrf2 family protein
MLFSTATGYALRALAAMFDNGPFCTAKGLAQELELPAPYLAKILKILAAKGLLQSTRGKGGGFRLARPAHLVTMRDVVDALGDRTSLSGCLMGCAACNGELGPCPLHRACATLVTQMELSLAQITIRHLQVSRGNPARQEPMEPASQRRAG